MTNEQKRKYQDDPNLFVEEQIGIKLYSEQQLILNQISNSFNNKLSISACHASGKSLASIMAGFWYAKIYDGSSSFIFVPTYRQAHTLWAEFIHSLQKKWYILTEKAYILKNSIMFENESILYITSCEEIEKFSNLHKMNVLIIFDEAGSIPDKYYHYADSISSIKDNKLMLIGTPTRKPNTIFHRTFKPYIKNKQNDLTNGISGFDLLQIPFFHTPNIKYDYDKKQYIDKDPLPYPNLITADYVDKMIDLNGEDSDFVRTKIWAEFPKG